MLETAADRLGYLTTFGEDVDFSVTTDSGLQTWSKLGILDNEFIDVNGVESRQPILVCRLDDIYQPGQLQNIEFRAKSVQIAAGGYSVVEVQDDGTGMATLILEIQ